MSRLNRSLLALTLTTAIALAGCGSGNDSSAPAPTAAPEVLQDEVPTESPAPEVAPNEEGHRENDTLAGASADTCLTENLDITLGDKKQGPDGTEYEIEFTNLGDECQMIGFPEVSLIGEGNGRQIGALAGRANARSSEVVLDKDDSAVATLTLRDTSGTESCAIVTGDGLRVFPPANTNSLFVPAADFQGCDNPEVSSLTVSPVS